MKKIRAIICLMIISISIVSVHAIAAGTSSFSFTFTNGIQRTGSVRKDNTNVYAVVNVTSSGANNTYRYAVANGSTGNYITEWTTQTGTGSITLDYKSGKVPIAGNTVRLCIAPTSSSGISTVSGLWIP